MAKTIKITEDGLLKLQNELEYLKTEGRTDIAEKIKIARGYGDLSENSEYDEAKNEQAKIEARIVEIEAILKNVEIIEEVIDNVLANGDYLRDNFVQQFVEVRNLALGDENRFYIEGEVQLEVAEFSGSHYDLKRQKESKTKRKLNRNNAETNNPDSN